MVHELFSEKSLVQLKERHPQALVLAHPECTEAVLRHADYVGSTTGILTSATQSPAAEFIGGDRKRHSSSDGESLPG